RRLLAADLGRRRLQFRPEHLRPLGFDVQQVLPPAGRHPRSRRLRLRPHRRRVLRHPADPPQEGMTTGSGIRDPESGTDREPRARTRRRGSWMLDSYLYGSISSRSTLWLNGRPKKILRPVVTTLPS